MEDLNIRIGQQLLVSPVSALDEKLVGARSSAVKAGACNGDDVHVAQASHRLHVLHTNESPADDAGF